MNPRFKTFKLLFLFPLSLALLYHVLATFCDIRTDGFSVARIHSDLSYRSDWETAPLSPENKIKLESGLEQKFHYLGCGGQCFAFGSEDGRYVIKFFKHKIRKPYSYFLKLPLPWPLSERQKRYLEKALFKLNRDFTSYKIAYEELQEETGVIYIHLNKGPFPSPSVTIVDKLGIEHQIALDKVEFVIQSKAELVYSRIEGLMVKGDLAEARQALRAILEVIVSRCKKGIFDEDPRIHRNFGFVNDKPIFIDVGRFVRDPLRKDPSVYKADLRTITKRFRSWLNESYPELVTILDEELHAFEIES